MLAQNVGNRIFFKKKGHLVFLQRAAGGVIPLRAHLVCGSVELFYLQSETRGQDVLVRWCDTYKKI